MPRLLRSWSVLALVVSFVACSPSSGPTDLGDGSGGGSAASGGAASGSGGAATGGGTADGATGGAAVGSGGGATGGAAAGGTVGTGGASAGGSEASGGQSSSGGEQGTGGGEPVDCTFVPDPALAEGESGAMIGATAAHNEWRLRAGVPPVRWNQELADGAQAYADTCPSGHSPNEYREDRAGFQQVGENLYSGTDVLHGIALFAEERLLYEFGTEIAEDNFTPIGHYTQMVWSDTTDVGCAVGDCGMWRTVCWYGPAGNYLGEAPYGESEGACLDLDNDDVFQFEDADDTDRDVD